MHILPYVKTSGTSSTCVWNMPMTWLGRCKIAKPSIFYRIFRTPYCIDKKISILLHIPKLYSNGKTF